MTPMSRNHTEKRCSAHRGCPIWLRIPPEPPTAPLCVFGVHGGHVTVVVAVAGTEHAPEELRAGSGEEPAAVVRSPVEGHRVNARGRRIVIGTLSAVVIVAMVVAGYGWWTYQQVDRVDLDLAEIAYGRAPQLPHRSVPTAGRRSTAATRTRRRYSATTHRRATVRQHRDPAGRPRQRAHRRPVHPRDLWVTLPDGEQQRINAAYAQSTQTLIDTIDENLGIPIHHFVEVDFVGFQQLIDSLGGVPMYFDSPVRDLNSGLRDPRVRLRGARRPQGLAFARSRHLEYRRTEGWHTDPSGDLGRMTRQQLLMRAAFGKARSLGPQRHRSAERTRGRRARRRRPSTPGSVSVTSWRSVNGSPTSIPSGSRPTRLAVDARADRAAVLDVRAR